MKQDASNLFSFDLICSSGAVTAKWTGTRATPGARGCASARRSDGCASSDKTILLLLLLLLLPSPPPASLSHPLSGSPLSALSFGAQDNGPQGFADNTPPGTSTQWPPARRWWIVLNARRELASLRDTVIRCASRGEIRRPSCLNAGATFDAELVAEWGDAMGEEFWNKGVNIQEGPGLNIASAWRRPSPPERVVVVPWGVFLSL